MTKDEVMQRIYDGLSGVLSHAGFRLKQSDEGFFKKTPYGRVLIGVALYEYSTYFEFSIVTAMRFDAVESIVHECLQTPEKYRGMSDTIITPLEYFVKGCTSFRVQHPEDIEKATSKLSGIITENIVPFFERHSDIQALDESMNRRQDMNFDITHLPWMNRLVVARLACNDQYDLLVAQALENIRNHSETYQAQFRQLLRTLEHFEPGAK